MDTLARPLVLALALVLFATAAQGQVSFFLATGPDPSGDLAWQAAAGSARISEVDFEPAGPPVSDLDFGGVQAKVNVEDAMGVVNPEGVKTFKSPYFVIPGVLYNNALLNVSYPSGVKEPRIRFTFSRPVSGVGTWIFDDGLLVSNQFVMHVTLVGGQVVTSPALDSGLVGHEIDGFLGAYAEGGIVAATIEVQLGNGVPSDGTFELDHLQVAYRDLVGTRYCTPVVNSTGRPSRIVAAGSEVASDNILTLTANCLPLNQFGYFINSMTQGLVAGPGGSDGNLCLGGSIGRYAPPAGYAIQNSGTAGAISLILDLASTPTPLGPVSILAGETWNFQAWYRDNNPGPTSNFTDGVSVTFQ